MRNFGLFLGQIMANVYLHLAKYTITRKEIVAGRVVNRDVVHDYSRFEILPAVDRKKAWGYQVIDGALATVFQFYFELIVEVEEGGHSQAHTVKLKFTNQWEFCDVPMSTLGRSLVESLPKGRKTKLYGMLERVATRNPKDQKTYREWLFSLPKGMETRAETPKPETKSETPVEVEIDPSYVA